MQLWLQWNAVRARQGGCSSMPVAATARARDHRCQKDDGCWPMSARDHHSSAASGEMCCRRCGLPRHSGHLQASPPQRAAPGGGAAPPACHTPSAPAGSPAAAAQPRSTQTRRPLLSHAMPPYSLLACAVHEHTLQTCSSGRPSQLAVDRSHPRSSRLFSAVKGSTLIRVGSLRRRIPPG